jgi:hypothetical protein
LRGACRKRAHVGCLLPIMDRVESGRIAFDEQAVSSASKPGSEPPPIASPPLSVPIVLLLLAVVIVAGGGALVRHFRGTTYLISYAAGVLALLALPLLALGRRRERIRGKSRLLLACSPRQWTFFAVFVLSLALYGVTRFGPTPFYEPSVQATAFLHGHSWVDAPGYMEQVGPICNTNLPIAKRLLPDCDLSRFHGHTFLVHPPLAAIIMMPIVALHGGTVAGADEYQPSVSAVLGAIEVALAWRLLTVLGLSTSASLWLTAFFGIGTTLWYEATLGSSWDFVLVTSVLPTLLALNELFGKARPWVVGLFAALAALARNDLVLAWPAYCLLLLTRGRRVREILGVVPGFAMAGIVYGVFNITRYGTFFDQSLRLWYRCCDGGGYFNPSYHRMSAGPFSLHFLPINLHTLFFLGWGFNFEVFPYLHPLGGGQALLLTSPAFILALRPSLKRAQTLLLWLASALTMSASLLVYASGFMQFGTRYYVQIFPFLLVLIALGVGRGRRVDQFSRILILASIGLVTFGVWHIHMYSFG